MADTVGIMIRKNYVIFLWVWILSGISCQKEPEEPDEKKPEPYEMPCGCGDEWPQDEPVCQGELVWDYPVKPGTEEWAQLWESGGYQGIRKALQIPEDILSSLSTEDLTEICLQYPFLNELTLHGNRDYGLDLLFDEFNGVRELFQREDASKELLKQYRCAMQKLKDKTLSDYENAVIWIPVHNWTVLLSRCESQDDQKEYYIEILKHLICGYERRTEARFNVLGIPLFLDLSLHSDNFFARLTILSKIDEQIIEEMPEIEIYHFDKDFMRYLRVAKDPEMIMRIINDLSCQFIQLNQQ